MSKLFEAVFQHVNKDFKAGLELALKTTGVTFRSCSCMNGHSCECEDIVQDFSFGLDRGGQNEIHEDGIQNGGVNTELGV